MAYQIGTDEAGYGPNLGPLVVTGTLWSLPRVDQSLYRLLNSVVSDQLVDHCLAIADSKKLYQSTGSLAVLETSVLSVLFAQLTRLPTDWLELAEVLCGDDVAQQLPAEIWLANRRLSLPLVADKADIQRWGARLRDVLESHRVEILQMRSTPVFPSQFNRQIESLGNKAALLSSVTLKMVRALLKDCNDETAVVCDKHGGRSKYSALLQEYATDQLARVHEESLENSRYTWQANGNKVTIDFKARGESFLPTALASMISKYLREVFMHLWNEFWQSHIPNLRPTKGYPTDARRFKAEIATTQRVLNIADETIWRNR